MQSHLVLSCVFHHLLIDNVIHQLKSFDSFFLCYANELLLQRHWSETVVKEEETFFGIHPKKRGHIFKVRQSCTQAHKANVFLSCLHVSNCSAFGKRKVI